MPRGVEIPEIRQQLFAALERVVVADGPGKISGRAITVGAGVATGLLYAHFSDLDGFLCAYAVDRSFAISAAVAPLGDQVGQGTVVDNITSALLDTPLVTLRALTRLLATRPDVIIEVERILGADRAGLDAIPSVLADYIAKEQRAGRTGAINDPEATALAVVGLLHRLVIGVETERSVRAALSRSLAALINPTTSAVRGRVR